SSLPQRFAELPGVEADSSQWFGEGKAIAADTKNLRKNLKKWAKENFSGKTTVPNADTGWEVRVTPKGIESSLSHGFDEPLARSVPFIPQIVESGIHVASAKKKAGLMSHIFANKIRLDGKDYVVGFVVREDANGNRFYDHELTEIIDPGWLYQDHFQKKENWYTEPANRGDVMNILRDKLGVNDGSGQVLFQTAWHGTPHRFDEFSLDAIGTGEGNQAHGWGLYFAQKRGTSERYKTDLGVNITLDGKPFYDGVKGTLESSTGNKIADDELLASIGNIDEAIAELQNDVDYGVPEAVDALEVLRNIKAGDRLKVEERGQLFEVDIPEDDVLLDEQKPYYDQPEVVRKAIHAIRDEFGEEASLGDILKDWSGKGVYNYLRGKLGTDKAASLWLNEHGVKGITYDGQQDGRCFVVFDDKAIDVLNTYFQADAKPASARGAIVFRPEDGQALIGLFRGKADISTVIHEGAGHFFLENLRAAAQRPNAPAWVRDGWKDVAKAIGADADPGRSIGTEAHEAFANMAVDYFRRGEAPNIALTTTFQRFARWLAHIYRALTRRGELRDVTPEVKRVMDRLLVAEDQLRAREINRRVTDARNDEADLLRAGLAGREKRDIMRAQEKALADMAAGQPVDVGPVLRDSQALRKARALQREFPDSEAGASSGKTALEPDYSIERRDDFPPAPEVKSGEDAEMSDMDADAAVDADVEARMADLEAQGKLDGEDAALLAEAADQAARIEKYEELGQSVLECVMEVAE
ncbi:hypothetical protein ACQRA4_10130, partial [Desulfovibrio sp. SGI.169]